MEFFWMIPEQVTLVPDLAIVPTIVLPFALIGVLLSALATVVAGWFGIELKAEGPKKLLELLLNRRTLFWILLSNTLVWLGIYGYKNLQNLPKPLWWVEFENRDLPKGNESYEDIWGSKNMWEGFAGDQRDLVGLDPLWEVDIAEGSFGGMAVAGKSAFFGSFDKRLYELSADSGQLIRSFYIGTSVTPLPTIYANRLYIGEGEHDTIRARVYQWDLLSGSLIGSAKTKGHTEGNASLAVIENKPYLVLVAGKDGVKGVDATDMKELWHYPRGHTDAEPLIHEGIAYVAFGRDKDDDAESADRPRAVAIEVVSGKVLWERELAASGWHMPMIYGDLVCFGVGELYFKTSFGQLACYSKADGAIGPSLNTNGPLITYPLRIGDRAITMDFYGELCVHNLLAPMKTLWCKSTLAPGLKTYSTPVYDGQGNILVSVRDEGIAAFDFETGEKQLLWEVPQGQKWRPAATMTLRQGELFVVDWVGNKARKFALRYRE